MTATSDIITDPTVIAHLRSRYNAINASHAGNDTQKGLWAPLYEELYALLTDYSGFDHAKPGVDPQSWLWLRGARFVNAGDGPFAALIRDYTIIQHQLRYGVPATEDEMNRASNNIARAYLGQWLGYDRNGNFLGDAAATQPNIDETGRFDAGPAAASVFNKEDAAGDPAGWAGTLLFGITVTVHLTRFVTGLSTAAPASLRHHGPSSELVAYRTEGRIRPWETRSPGGPVDINRHKT